MRFCTRCGFPLGTRPGLYERDGVCGACLNDDIKKAMIADGTFKKRQEWLTKHIADNKTHPKYDCVVAVSGGKDSHAIVKRLYENHGVKNALLVSVTDEFTHTKAGQKNIDSLVRRYNCDHITFRCEPETFRRETKKDFTEELHPLKWIEDKIYSVPVEIAKAYGIKLVFFGENSAFEYGSSPDLCIFHPSSDAATDVIYMGAIYPYSIVDSLSEARSIGFIDLDDTGEWQREGSIEQYTQIDSVAYMVQLWTKYVKYGFQRVADIACRFVREGKMTRDEAVRAIMDNDHILDPSAKHDFCTTIGITGEEFDMAVDIHANTDIVERRGKWWVNKDY